MGKKLYWNFLDWPSGFCEYRKLIRLIVIKRPRPPLRSSSKKEWWLTQKCVSIQSPISNYIRLKTGEGRSVINLSFEGSFLCLNSLCQRMVRSFPCIIKGNEDVGDHLRYKRLSKREGIIPIRFVDPPLVQENDLSWEHNPMEYSTIGVIFQRQPSLRLRTESVTILPHTKTPSVVPLRHRHTIKRNYLNKWVRHRHGKRYPET